MIRCFVSDLDGTLLDGQDSLAIESAEIIKEAMNFGYEFIIASGRSKESVAKVFHPYQMNCIRILCNGALILDVNDAILYEKPFDIERIRRMISVLDSRGFDIQLYTKAGIVTFDAARIRNHFVYMVMRDRNMNEAQANAYIDERFYFDYQEIIHDLDQYLSLAPTIYKLEAYCDDEESLYEAIQALKPIANLDINIANLGLEITDIGAQKGIALDWLMQRKGFMKEEVAVFGDGMNDRMMLESYPHSYAPKNAKDDVKALAAHVIGSNKEQGVASMIQHIVNMQGRL